MKKTLKKICSCFLVVAMMLTLLSGMALAADGNYLKITAEKTDDTTVVLTVKLVKAITDLGSLNVKFVAPDGFDYQSLTAEKLSAGGNLSASATPGWFYQTSPLSLSVDDVLYVVTYKTASAIADGNYDFSVEVTDAAKPDFSDHEIIRDKATCTLNVSTPVAEGYTVSMTASANEVETNGTVDINLDVTNSDASVTTFNAVDMTLTYDSTLFTYDATNSTLNGCEVDSTTAGTLYIKRHGENVTMGEGNELVLKFTATGETGAGAFALTAKVAQAATADTNIAAATVTDSPQSVTVKAPEVAKYTVTFDANGYGTAPEAITVESGNTITAPTAPTAVGYTFGGWYKEAACTNEWDFDSDTVTNDITLYAKWTKNEAAVDEVTLNTNYLSGYTLIGITVKDANGKVPQYSGKAMYKVNNATGKTFYNADTYYYVVSGTVTDEDAVKGAVSFGTGSAETITKTGDANCTNWVDINDAQFIYNLYNNMGTTYAVNAKQLLSSDVNGDGKVGTTDCAAAVAAIQ